MVDKYYVTRVTCHTSTDLRCCSKLKSNDQGEGGFAKKLTKIEEKLGGGGGVSNRGFKLDAEKFQKTC